MSHTAKTTPWIHQIRRDLDHRATPVHDHRFNECDLPEHPDSTTESVCHWVPSIEALHGPNHLAPIDPEVPNFKKRDLARAERRESHREAHELTRAASVGLDPDDLDDIL